MPKARGGSGPRPNKFHLPDRGSGEWELPGAGRPGIGKVLRRASCLLLSIQVPWRTATAILCHRVYGLVTSELHQGLYSLQSLLCLLPGILQTVCLTLGDVSQKTLRNAPVGKTLDSESENPP